MAWLDQKNYKQIWSFAVIVNSVLFGLMFFSSLSSYFLAAILVVINAFLFLPFGLPWWRFSFVTGLATILFLVLGDRPGALCGAEIFLLILGTGLVLGSRDSFLSRFGWLPIKIDWRQINIRLLLVGVLAVVALLVLRAILIGRGVILDGDFNMPVDISTLVPGKFLSLWAGAGSFPQITFINDYLFFLILSFISRSGQWSIEIFQKSMFVIPVVVALVGSLALFRYCLARAWPQLISGKKTLLWVLVGLGAAWYALNPWSLGLVGHYFHWLSYAALPLIAWSVFQSWDCQRSKFLLWAVLTAAISAVFITSPHFWFYLSLILLIAVGVQLGFFLVGKQWSAVLKILWRSSVLALLIILASSYWLFPILQSWQNDQSLPTPNYFWRAADVLAAQSDVNIWLPFSLQTSDGGINWPGLVFGFYCLGGLFLSLASSSRRRGGGLFFFLVFLLGSVGVAFFLYWPDLFFRIFNGLSIGWLGRDPTRILSILPLAYSFGFVAATASICLMILKRRPEIGRSLAPLVSVIFTGGLVMAMLCLPEIKAGLGVKYVPVPLPEDYRQVFNIINSDSNQAGRVAWYPAQKNSQGLTWLSEKKVDNFVNSSSLRPSLSPQSDEARMVLEYFETDWRYMPQYNYLLGAKFTVVRKDLPDSAEIAAPAISQALSADSGQKRVFSGDILEVYETDHFLPQVQAKDCLISIMGGLDVLPSLLSQAETEPSRCGYVFLDQLDRADLVERVVRASDLIMFHNVASDSLSFRVDQQSPVIYPAEFTNQGDPDKSWVKASVTDPLHGEWHNEIEKRGMFNWDFDSGRGMVFANEPDKSGNQIIRIDLPRPLSGVDVYARVFRNWSGGEIKLRSGKIELGRASTAGPDNTFQWQKVGSLAEDFDQSFVELINWSGFNAVTEIKFVDLVDQNQAIEKSAALLSEIPYGTSRHLLPQDLIAGLDFNLTDKDFRLSVDYRGADSRSIAPKVAVNNASRKMETREDKFENSGLSGSVHLSFPEISGRDLPGADQDSGSGDFIEVKPGTEYALIAEMTARQVANFSAKIYEFSESRQKAAASHGLFERINGDYSPDIYYRRFKTKKDTKYLKIKYENTPTGADSTWRVDRVKLLLGQDVDRLATGFYNATAWPESFGQRQKNLAFNPSLPSSFDASRDSYHLSVPAGVKLVALQESFDRGWQLTGPSSVAAAVPIYGFYNGYLFDAEYVTGDYEISYRLTKSLQTGYLVTLATVGLGGAAGFLIYCWARRCRGTKERI